MSDYSVCRSCGARIRWIKTISGKAMPCDAEEIRFNRGGGPETFVTPEGKVERGRRCREGEYTGYISHFATCPFADCHRKRKPTVTKGIP